ncbi:hypothetical protein IG631_05975 [Alternaria alternata]|nr:hypothetical protein IG631_05975 [Alternaria alternata]
MRVRSSHSTTRALMQTQQPVTRSHQRFGTNAHCAAGSHFSCGPDQTTPRIRILQTLGPIDDNVFKHPFSWLFLLHGYLSKHCAGAPGSLHTISSRRADCSHLCFVSDAKSYALASYFTFQHLNPE